MTTDRPTGAAYPEIIERSLAAIAALCRRYAVRRLDLFGSAATGRFDLERSDLDFLVEFEAVPAPEYSAAYFDLREALETLFGRRIDLITEPALKNPYLRRQIEGEKRTLFQSS
jgi:hypothetical protein